MEPSTVPAMVSGSRAVTCPLMRIAGPISAAALMEELLLDCEWGPTPLAGTRAKDVPLFSNDAVRQLPGNTSKSRGRDTMRPRRHYESVESERRTYVGT